MDDETTPLPKPDMTPPVTKMYFMTRVGDGGLVLFLTGPYVLAIQTEETGQKYDQHGYSGNIRIIETVLMCLVQQNGNYQEY